MSRMRWGLVAIASIVAIVGCGKSDKPSAGYGSGSPKGVDTPEPQRGGHIRLPSNEPRWLNPILETRYDLANTLIFEGLVGIDAKGDPIPKLAKSWTMSSDGLTLTFKLRDGLVWHDGQQLTSEDVAFTFETVRNLPVQRSTLWKAYMAPVVNVKTPDDTTVIVSYAQPYAPALAAWTMPILPSHVYRGEDDLADSKGNREAVGSGPFKLQRWEPGKLILLAANDKWWGGPPMVSTVELVLGVQNSAMLTLLRKGDLDWAPIPTIDDQSELTQSPDLRDEFETAQAVEPRLRMIAWNTDKRPYDDKRVRQALTMALDRSRVIEDVLHGQGQLLSGPFFPGMMGADPSIAPMPFDLAKAKDLLTQALAKPSAGSGASLQLKLNIDMIAVESQKSPVTDAAFAIWKRDLETIGVGIKLTFLPAKEYFEKISNRDFDAAFFGWLPDIPDPDPYALLHSTQIGIGANYAGYANDEVDKLLDDARTATDPQARKAIYAKVHAIVADDLPYTPLFSPYGFYAWNRRLHGVGARDLGPQPLVPGIAHWWVASQVMTN